MTALDRFKNILRRRVQKRYVIFASIFVFIGLIVFGVVSIFALDQSTWSVGEGLDTELVTGSSDSVVITSSSVTLGEYDVLVREYNQKSREFPLVILKLFLKDVVTVL
jgi:TRAP-type C4-dicarboxylate transport system permease small subunit